MQCFDHDHACTYLAEHAHVAAGRCRLSDSTTLPPDGTGRGKARARGSGVPAVPGAGITATRHGKLSAIDRVNIV